MHVKRCMSLFLSVCMFVHFIYVHMLMCVLCLYGFTSLHVCFMYVCERTCEGVCMCVHIVVFTSIYVHVCMFVHFIYVYMLMCVYICVRVYVCGMNMCMCLCIICMCVLYAYVCGV